MLVGKCLPLAIIAHNENKPKWHVVFSNVNNMNSSCGAHVTNPLHCVKLNVTLWWLVYSQCLVVVR